MEWAGWDTGTQGRLYSPRRRRRPRRPVRAAPLPEVPRPGPQEGRPPSARAGAGRVPASAPQGACGGHAPAGTHLRGTPAPPACCTPPTCAVLSAQCRVHTPRTRARTRGSRSRDGGSPGDGSSRGNEPPTGGPAGNCPTCRFCSNCPELNRKRPLHLQSAGARGRQDFRVSRELLPRPPVGACVRLGSHVSAPPGTRPESREMLAAVGREGWSWGGAGRGSARVGPAPRGAPRDGVTRCIRARAQKRAAFPVRAASRAGRYAWSCCVR